MWGHLFKSIPSCRPYSLPYERSKFLTSNHSDDSMHVSPVNYNILEHSIPQASHHSDMD